MRGQLQTLEPIIITIVLVVIAGIGIAVYADIAGREAVIDKSVIDRQEDLALLQRISAAPELSCPLDVSAGTYCIDLAKAQAFARLQDAQARVFYRPIFGETQVSLEIIDLDTGSASPLQLYDAATGKDFTATRSYVVAYDPIDGNRHFATLVIRRAR